MGFSFLDRVEFIRGVDVNKRTVTFLQLGIGGIGPLYEQLSIFILCYWPHLSLNQDFIIAFVFSSLVTFLLLKTNTAL